MTTRELYAFHSPSQEDLAWAREKTDADQHLPALTLALKCFQRLDRFAEAREVPVMEVEPWNWMSRSRRCTDRRVASGAGATPRGRDVRRQGFSGASPATARTGCVW
ncbi:hypothetical protein ABZU75_21680 [Streptosporangium sp. NPDC005286]|uniref:hypothetical protein n=1 Tax=Streptosporangium sp. NPDC005286 TaxID=3154463 RepID=UPI0033BFAC61